MNRLFGAANRFTAPAELLANLRHSNFLTYSCSASVGEQKVINFHFSYSHRFQHIAHSISTFTLWASEPIHSSSMKLAQIPYQLSTYSLPTVKY
jgi:hypothetical protein